MPDREKVIKGLEHCATGTNNCDRCPMKYDCKGTANGAMVAAIKLLKDDETQFIYLDEVIKAHEDEIERLKSGWISVKDRLPEGFQKVLVFWRQNGEPMVDTAFWSDGHSTEHWEGVEITHWMPLPEPPPKEDEHETN